ncbi:hypothetical protein Dimus_006759 [Dionaea muscipula]
MAAGVGRRNRWLSVFSLFYTVYSMMGGLTSATVFLIVDKNASIPFEDIAANFAPEVRASGICGKLYAADPIEACSTLTDHVKPGGNNSSPFALIIRGGCSFEEKVRRAQAAGFEAAIVYDNNDGGGLIAMAGNSAGIRIPAVFVSQATGEKLKKYTGIGNMEIWIVPSYENSAWSIVAISFISLLAMSAVLATCFFVRRHRIRRGGGERHQPRVVREFHGMSRRLVKAMPSLIFTAVLEENCTASTCAICLDDYKAGDKLRVLPCQHKFHAFCVDAWLTTWRTFCPVCKRDARMATGGDPPASESTPLLLSSGQTSVASSVLSSSRFSLRSSSAIQIAAAAAPQSQSTSLSNTTPQIPCSSQPPPYYHRSPSMSVSRSSFDLRNMSSSRRSPASHLVSPRSIGYPSLSPLDSSYISPYILSLSNGNASPGYLPGALVLPPNRNPNPNPLHYSESAASFSPFASTHSLDDVDPAS